MRPVPAVAVEFVAAHEGCRLFAYQDSATVWTIGFGHTLGVTQGASCSLLQARFWLEEDLGVAGKRLAGVLDEAVILKLTDHQYAALLSFAFNVGCSPGWTIWKRLNAQAFGQVPAELSKFVFAAGRVIPGLVNRRAAEVALWNTPDLAQPAPAPPPAVSSAVTRDAVQASANTGFLSRLWNRFA